MPPTPIPGECLWKFHLLMRLRGTSSTSSPILGRTFDNSLTKAISISLCTFSISFEASATSILPTYVQSSVVVNE